MEIQLSTPPRSLNVKDAMSSLSTPTDMLRRIPFSFTAPSKSGKRLEADGSTFVMSNSSGKNQHTSRRHGSTFEGSLMDDEESVLVASPFSYITPPMPPREEVSNTKTTRAMAKIVEEEGTPDSVIRQLSFLNGEGTSESSFDDQPAPGTVNRAARVRASTDTSDKEQDDSFGFPSVTPSQEVSRVNLEGDSPSEGVSRFSLSMVDIYPPTSPKRARPGSATMSRGGDSSDSSLLPDMLINCGTCGKQFISDQHLSNHQSFCRPENSRGRLGNSDASTLAQTTDSAALLERSPSDNRGGCFTDSPALPLYMQRAARAAAAAQKPPVAPLPLQPPASPSILASPTDLRISSEDQEYLEEEISTFLECLRSDVRSAPDNPDKWTPPLELSALPPTSSRQNLWASRRTKAKTMGRMRSENSLCVSSDDSASSPSPNNGGLATFTLSSARNGLVLTHRPVASPSPSPPPILPPPLPSSSNVSMTTSPIAQRCSFDQDASMTTSFLQPGRASPSFGRASFRSSVASSAPSVTDSSVTPLRMSTGIRFPCQTCGRLFATQSRLTGHETVCANVFRQSRDINESGHREVVVAAASSPKKETVADVSSEDSRSITCIMSEVAGGSCKFCQRHFSHSDRLVRHEAICLSVFNGTKRPIAQRPSAGSVKDESSEMENSVLHRPTTVRNSSKLSLERISAVHVTPKSPRNFPQKPRAKLSVTRPVICAFISAPVVKRTTSPAVFSVSVQTTSEITTPVAVMRPHMRGRAESDADGTTRSELMDRLARGISCDRLRAPVHVGHSFGQDSNVSSVSSSVGSRTSLEFQYQLLREQIRTCSDKLKQRQRSSSSVSVRDG